MNIEYWLKKINSLQLIGKEKIKKIIIDFFILFHSDKNHNFIKIEDKQLNMALDNISFHKSLLISFDIEFQHIVLDNNKINFHSRKIMTGDETAHFIREMAMLFFINDDKGNWYYIGNIFINLKPLHTFGFPKHNLLLISHIYSTVTPETKENMKELQNGFHIHQILDDIIPCKGKENVTTSLMRAEKIKDVMEKLKQNYFIQKFGFTEMINHNIEVISKNKNSEKIITDELRYMRKKIYQIQFNIVYKYLNNYFKKKFIQAYNTYWEDPLVRERTKLTSGKEEKFCDLLIDMSYFSKFLVKGLNDLQCIENTIKLVKGIEVKFDRYDLYYDIAIFNGYSSNFFGSAMLEVTYQNLLPKKSYKNMELTLNRIHKLIGGDIQAHNPLVDAYYTLVVGVVINNMINNSD